MNMPYRLTKVTIKSPVTSQLELFIDGILVILPPNKAIHNGEAATRKKTPSVTQSHQSRTLNCKVGKSWYVGR